MNCLIADAGSTKVHWRAPGSGLDWVSPGINPVTMTTEEVGTAMRNAIPGGLCVDTVYYYGAGCATADLCGQLADALRFAVPDAKEIHVATDILGAARALFGDSPGVACIMGTGSVARRYDGHDVLPGVPALGWILGDEGSGAVLGRHLVTDVLKGQLPKDLCQRFLRWAEIDSPEEVVDRVYRQPSPNRWLASLMPFVAQNLHVSELREMVEAQFHAFFSRNVDVYDSLPVGLVGSVAFYFQNLLRPIAVVHGHPVTTILQDPMDALCRYHEAFSG